MRATILFRWRAASAVILLCAALQPVAAAEPQVELLWPDGAPGALGNEDVDKPTLSIWRPPANKANGCAVVVCPGGGYSHLATDHEGKQIAEWLNSLGVTGCVLKYRLGPRYNHPAPLQDAQRAIRFVRAHAKEWDIDPERVGILGFSAGGHLASTAATHFEGEKPDTTDRIDRPSSRPDFAVLCYPVISLSADFVHKGSRKNLLGDNPSDDEIKNLSNDLQVTAQTPPTFLWHTNEDKGVIPEHSVLFYLALRKANVPAELHIYEKGKHGLGLAPNEPGTATWPGRCADWMKNHGWLNPNKIVASDPSAVTDPDFSLQGEYSGEMETDEGKQKIGVQVVALGKGRFHAVGYIGGLPGDGWNRGEKREADGELHGAEVVFQGGDACATLRDGAITLANGSGQVIGRMSRIERKSPTLGLKPPADAVVLFDGSNADTFEGGRMTPDGLLMEGATSRRKFGSGTLHIEFRTPYQPLDIGQARGNSGCYLQGRYEVQILDSFGLAGNDNECGGLYSVKSPDQNMCYPPLTWQTYDIDFTAATYDTAGALKKPARITVSHNGVVVHKDVELLDRATTGAPVRPGPEPGPIFLQNHGNPVRFRNIWFVEKK